MMSVGVMNRPMIALSSCMYAGSAVTSRSSKSMPALAKKLFAAWQSPQVGWLYMMTFGTSHIAPDLQV
jgi:hypothetical protein